MFKKYINADIPLKTLTQNYLISRLCQQIEKINKEIKDIKNHNIKMKKKLF